VCVNVKILIENRKDEIEENISTWICI